MFFLHLYCKKEIFFPFTAWFLLSGFSMLLTSNLEACAYLSQQLQANNIIEMNTLDTQNECDQLNLNVIITENKKFVTLHTDSMLPISIFQSILALNLFLITTIVIDTKFCNLQTQYFENKRAPPIT
ncbi:hypothetical protein HWV54_01150 [Bartonella alsatica]|uniref:Uncharacterized protein n=2 Tax=Bartonella alsatica TaxID=52764 RepID=J1IWY5_9HYPH|nr:hypothetical protein [Bartonella alsatica]EJF75760.1 hypothetical protein MEC_00315 [Bartonella alsatica IBS 382]QLC51585.1 hypothetical protein HWV54_01150 [Bartonella alsatica]